MAISGGDGSIILTTKVDTSGISKGSLSIRSALQGVDNTVKKVQNSFSAFREQKVTLQTLNQAIKDQQYVLNSLNLEYAEYVAKGKASSTQAKELKANIDAATAEMKEMQAAAVTLGAKGSTSINKIGTAMKTLLSYFIGIQTIFKVINFSGEAAEFATQTEASVQRLVDIYGEAAQSVGDFIDANARAIGMSRSAGASIASTYGNLLSVWADQETNAQLTNNLLNQTAVVASKTGRTTTDVAERIRSGLLGNTEAIEDLGINVNIKTIEITDAFKRIADGRSWEQLNAYEQSQVRTLAILEQSTNKYGTTVAETTATVRNQYQAAYEDFQNTWGQVVNTVLIPVLKILTQVFTVATKGLQIIAGLSGKTVDNSKIQESSIGGAVENQKALTKEIEKTNKAQKKSLAAFDELNILSQENASASSGTGTTGGANVSDLGLGDVGGNYDSSFADKVSGDMAAIMGIVGGALIAIGLILIFFGHIGWGIGFIIAGASVFAVSMATISSSDQVTPISEKLMAIMAIAGIALTAIGLILLFYGQWKWGIGFIVAGASALAVSIVAVESGNATEEAEQMLLDIMLIAGSALLALGIILLLAGQVTPLSIGLVVAGAGSLAGAVALNPQEVGKKIKKFFKDNAGLIIGVASALLVLGVVLCLCGVITPLSIGLIVAGAGILAAEVTLNWDGTKTTIKKFFQDNSGLIVGISSAILVLGVILLVCGIVTPLSIGMIVFGATGLVTETALNWDYVLDKLDHVVEEWGGWIAGAGTLLLVIGIILCATGVALPLGIALIVAGASGLVTPIVMSWNAIVDWVKGAWKAVKDFWNKNIAPIFTLKWWKNLAKTCGNGLISGFEAAVNGVIWLFESLINFVVSGLNLFISGLSTVTGAVGDLIGVDLRIPKIPKASLGRVSIPRLAQGAVIPPNREFLAVLGDQKRGTNIEAPLDTIKQAVAEVLSQVNVGGSSGRIEVPVIIDGREVARAVREAESNMGSQTVFGGFANVY